MIDALIQFIAIFGCNYIFKCHRNTNLPSEIEINRVYFLRFFKILHWTYSGSVFDKFLKKMDFIDALSCDPQCHIKHHVDALSSLLSEDGWIFLDLFSNVFEVIKSNPLQEDHRGSFPQTIQLFSRTFLKVTFLTGQTIWLSRSEFM